MSSDVQGMIDAFEYPANHQYDLATMQPVGQLKARLRAFDNVAPDFFTHGRRFLDVGCNKGFFSLRASRHFESVVGIDDAKYQSLWQKILRPGMEFTPETFQAYVPPDERFDKVFFGNVHYKLWIPSRSWDWVHKLASLSSGQVLIEGPVDNKEPLLEKLPIFQHPEFTFDCFMARMGKYFHLESKTRHPVIKGRWLMLFQRRKDAFDCKVQLNILKPFKRTLVATGTKGSGVFETTDGQICKIQRWGKSVNEPGLLRRLDIARLSPISNGIEAVVYRGDRFVGWLEKPLKIGGDRGSVVQLFKTQCRHQIFLIRNGFFDVDPAITNFGRNDENEVVLFDKDGVIAIRDCSEHWRNFYLGPKMLGKYYSAIASRIEIMKVLMPAVHSLDVQNLEQAFLTSLEILEGVGR